jgi:hypothetical protein
VKRVGERETGEAREREKKGLRTCVCDRSRTPKSIFMDLGVLGWRERTLLN